MLTIETVEVRRSLLGFRRFRVCLINAQKGDVFRTRNMPRREAFAYALQAAFWAAKRGDDFELTGAYTGEDI